MTFSLNHKNEPRPNLVQIDKIWDESPHSAFTDLIRFQNRWLCSFREASHHLANENEGGLGTIRLLAAEGKRKLKWKSYASLQADGDLRDPKLSVMPDGRLLLLATLCKAREERYTVVAFSNDGKRFTPWQRVLPSPEWLWRLTWHLGFGYGMSYSYLGEDDPFETSSLKLYRTEDGLNFELISSLYIEGVPSEATVRFLDNGQMVCLVRREEGSCAWMGKSAFPYTDWQWVETAEHLGGPNVLILPSRSIWLGGRLLRQKEDKRYAMTAIANWKEERCQSILPLPSGGDTSYPGMVFYQGHLFVSYYSSHEGKAAIYFAQLLLPE